MPCRIDYYSSNIYSMTIICTDHWKMLVRRVSFFVIIWRIGQGCAICDDGWCRSNGAYRGVLISRVTVEVIGSVKFYLRLAGSRVDFCIKATTFVWMVGHKINRTQFWMTKDWVRSSPDNDVWYVN